MKFILNETYFSLMTGFGRLTTNLSTRYPDLAEQYPFILKSYCGEYRLTFTRDGKAELEDKYRTLMTIEEAELLGFKLND